MAELNDVKTVTFVDHALSLIQSSDPELENYLKKSYLEGIDIYECQIQKVLFDATIKNYNIDALDVLRNLNIGIYNPDCDYELPTIKVINEIIRSGGIECSNEDLRNKMLLTIYKSFEFQDISIYYKNILDALEKLSNYTPKLKGPLKQNKEKIEENIIKSLNDYFK